MLKKRVEKAMRKRNIILTAKQAPVQSVKARLEPEEDFTKKSP